MMTLPAVMRQIEPGIQAVCSASTLCKTLLAVRRYVWVLVIWGDIRLDS